MGGVAKTVGRIGSGVFTLGGSELARKTLGENNLVSQALQAPGAVLTGGMSVPGIFMKGPDNPYVSGPFALDPAQMTADKAAITGLGEKQYADTLGAIDTNSSAQEQYAHDILGRMTPGIEEGLNSQHLLNSTALQQELGRQASYLAGDVASQNAQQKLAALKGRQGFEQSSVGRGLSLEDFINQANVAKTIGAQAAPQVGNGKGQTGALLSGVGSIAGPAAKLAMGTGKAASGNAPGAISEFAGLV